MESTPVKEFLIFCTLVLVFGALLVLLMYRMWKGPLFHLRPYRHFTRWIWRETWEKTKTGSRTGRVKECSRCGRPRVKVVDAQRSRNKAY